MKLKSIKNRGKFIVITGSNGVGKSEQVSQLAKHFAKSKFPFLCIKYPIYHIESGKKLYKILRTPKLAIKHDEYSFQKLAAKNRHDFEPTLIKVLNQEINVIAEDYTLTGVAWGVTRGLSLKEVEGLNKNLLSPDLYILLDGERFKSAIEQGHKNEELGEKFFKENRKIYSKLSKKYKCVLVNSNQSIEKVHADILKVVEEFLDIHR